MLAGGLTAVLKPGLNSWIAQFQFVGPAPLLCPYVPGVGTAQLNLHSGRNCEVFMPIFRILVLPPLKMQRFKLAKGKMVWVTQVL